MKFGVGQPVRRFEDQTLITGKGRYTDDITLPNMAQAFVVRAQAAHANIRKIDADSGAKHARRAAGADRRRREGRRARRRAVPRAAQQPGRLAAPRYAAPRARDRQGAPRRPAGRARRRRDLAQAQDAAEAIEIDYETLPAVTDARAALAQGAPQLFDGIPGNLVFDWDNDTSDFAATDAAFAKAAHVTTLEIVNNRVVANSMEPRNAIGDWDAAAGRPVLYTAHAGLAFRARSARRSRAEDPEGEAARRDAAECRRRLRHEGVRLSRAGAGGVGRRASSSGRCAGSPTARKRSSPTTRAATTSPRAELALDAKGKFLGIRVSLIANIGAYLSPMGPFIPTRSTDLISGLYTTPAIAINVKGVCTNTVPVCAYRGAGRPEASYLIERLVDAAARELNMTPDRIRRINLIPEKAIPYTSPTKLTFDSGEFEKIMDAAMEKADWKGFKARRRESQKRGKLRGIGMATYTERCGGGFPETASIEFKGDRVDLVMGNQEYGTGLVTSYKQVVSDRLGIDADLHRRRLRRHRPLAARPHRRLARAPRRRLGAARGVAQDHRQGQADRREPAGSLSRRHRIRRRAVPHRRHRPHGRSVRRREGGAGSGEAAARHGAGARHHAGAEPDRARRTRTAATSPRSRSIRTAA